MKTLKLALALTVAAALYAPVAHADPVSICNAPIQMSDGVTLRANVFLPKADGKFPVVLTATGYNKDTNNPFGLNWTLTTGVVSPECQQAETYRLRLVSSLKGHRRAPEFAVMRRLVVVNEGEGDGHSASCRPGNNGQSGGLVSVSGVHAGHAGFPGIGVSGGGGNGGDVAG